MVRQTILGHCDRMGAVAIESCNGGESWDSTLDTRVDKIDSLATVTLF